MKRTLVIGYGNTLRGDDGAGVRAAERIATRFPDAEVLLVHELQPEIAEVISRYEGVMFLDASAEGSSVSSTVIRPSSESRPDGSHGHSPATLLALCRNLYGHVPQRSLLVGIPGRNFGFCEHLSPFAESMVDQAIVEVGHYLVA